jgi:hypothetical protein
MPRKKAVKAEAIAAEAEGQGVEEVQLRARLIAELERGRAVQQRLALLAERFPQAYARLNLLFTLGRLQEARGGEFPDKIAFVHMPDVILNVRRIGKLDPESLTAAMEVYELGDIKPGILWIPVDQIMWAGTTDTPYGVERVRLEGPPSSTPDKDEQYEQARRALAGLSDGEPRDERPPPQPESA